MSYYIQFAVGMFDNDYQAVIKQAERLNHMDMFKNDYVKVKEYENEDKNIILLYTSESIKYDEDYAWFIYYLNDCELPYYMTYIGEDVEDIAETHSNDYTEDVDLLRDYVPKIVRKLDIDF